MSLILHSNLFLLSRLSAVSRGLFLVFAVVAGPATQALQAADLAKVFAKSDEVSQKRINHEVWTGLLKTYVKPGPDGINRVAYAQFKRNDHAKLKDYVRMLEGVDVGRLRKAEQFAFWANLYNAKTIDVVLDHYPVSSIRKISINAGLIGFLKQSVGAAGPWKAKILNVNGYKLSLDDVEHGILRPVFKDARVHYAVNCASIGCPNLRIAAFTGATLDADLDNAARAYINHPRGLDVASDKVRASSIYKWFVADFGGNERGVIAHMMSFASPELKSKLAGVTGIDAYHYDWALNDVN